MQHARQTLSLLLVSLFWLAGCVPPTPAVAPTPTLSPVAGAPGIGDPDYPGLGNGGYDVQSYTITLSVDPTENSLEGSTTLVAQALERLSAFDLDLHGLTVDSISVNAQNAAFTRGGDEVRVEPAMLLEPDQPFSVVVTYHGTPGLIDSVPLGVQTGWSHNTDNSINMWGEPDGAAVWFPGNNHPRDKATFRFEITVPDPWMVAASGQLKETKALGKQTRYVWEMNRPLATYLASINVGHYEVFTQPGPHGIAIRSYFPPDFPAAMRIQYNTLPAMISFFESLFGPYPFEEYGVVIAGPGPVCDYMGALEAQTLSIHCPNPEMSSQAVIAHELAHQWYGDSVSLENWREVWLKEGLATYADWLWRSRNDPAKMQSIARQSQKDFLDNPRYSVAEPATNNLYDAASYIGGALVFEGLRLEVGDEVFFDILRAYAEQYQYGNASTADFIALAEEVSDKDLTSFFENWLFSSTVPQLPE